MGGDFIEKSEIKKLNTIMEKIKDTEIFRLATILYADNNYEVSSKTILRKIVESIFLAEDNKIIGIHSLIDMIKDRYTLDFTEEEVKDIIKDTDFFITSDCKIEDIKISLNTKRLNNIKEKINTKNLDFFIGAFHKENDIYDLKELKELLYRFLYNVFQNNVLSFGKLIEPFFKVQELQNISDYNLKDKEIEVINKFLNWDNDEKNKIIYDISLLSVEYCLITNKKGDSFRLDSLKNKKFFLDTNIIFRAIGINGEDREKRTITFLEKFKEANENLFISKFTEEEINKTLEYYLSEIQKNNTPRVHSKIFIEYSKVNDFISFYHRWRHKRTNDNINLFRGHIMTLISNLKSKFNIENDFTEYFDEEDENIQEKISNKSSEINTFKTTSKISNLNTHIVDAKNIILIEHLRKNRSINIFDCKYFLISADQYLRKWDYSKNSSIPIVLLPSQWMVILLRYLNRTNDDFKSFVSFLNINNAEKIVSNENLQLILSGVSEITSDISQQKNIVSEIINNSFKGILDNSSNVDVREKSRTFAKTKLEEKIENLESDNKKLKNNNERLENNLNEFKQNTSVELEEIKKEKNESISEKKELISHLEKEKDNNKNLQERLANEKLKSYKKEIWWFILLLILCLGCIFLMFFFVDLEWNFVSKFIKWLNSFQHDWQKFFVKFIWGLPYGGIIYSGRELYNRICRKKLEEKLKKIKEDLKFH